MRKISISTGMLLLAGALLTGCGGLSKKVDKQVDAKGTLVYGFIDMDEASTPLEHFWLRQAGPDPDKTCCALRTHDGAFYRENIKPGAYQFTEFGGSGTIGSRMLYNANYFTYSFPRQTGGFHVKEPGLHYMGAFKFKKAGSFLNRKFDIEPIKSPSEKEVLEKILPYTEGTEWEARVRAHLKALK